MLCRHMTTVRFVSNKPALCEDSMCGIHAFRQTALFLDEHRYIVHSVFFRDRREAVETRPTSSGRDQIDQ